MFWLIAAAMVLIAFLIILPPLWRKHDELAVEDLDQRNIKIARDRLAELKANKASGGINQTQYDEQVTELELALSDDLELISPTQQTQNQGRWLVYVLAIAVPILSASLYWNLGDYQAINRINDPTPVNQADSSTPSPEAINKMVTALAEKLKAKPDNIEGWLMLGRSYKVLQKYPEAVDALDHAYQLAGDKAEVLLPYAEALAQANNNNWMGKPEELVTKALTIETDNPIGLWFAALAKAQQGDKKAAVGFLQKLEAALPTNSAEKKQIHEIIVNTENELANPTVTKPEQATVATNVSVTIQVNLAPELQTQANPGDTVFIYAQALSGPKMPLAIIRKQVSDLPLTVSLTDAESMLPNMKLSNFKEVRLLARISKTSNAMPQPGDLIGTVEQANLADSKVQTIVINNLIK